MAILWISKRLAAINRLLLHFFCMNVCKKYLYSTKQTIQLTTLVRTIVNWFKLWKNLQCKHIRRLKWKLTSTFWHVWISGLVNLSKLYWNARIKCVWILNRKTNLWIILYTSSTNSLDTDFYIILGFPYCRSDVYVHNSKYKCIVSKQ